MRRIFFLLIPFLISISGHAQTESTAAGHETEITVSAEANISAQPDMAEFQISILSREQQATEAFRVYLERYNALLSALRTFVDSTKLVTENLSISPAFNYQKPDQVTPDYYQVTASMSLSVPISKLNKILGQVTSIEGISLNGIAFRASNQDTLETEALKKAVMTGARESRGNC